MSDNLVLYNAVRQVPDTAKRIITAGRLKDKTDINPMWRIKVLTEQFGPCGFGWKYEIVDKRIEPGVNGEIAAFVDINLYIKIGNEWSSAIPGTGGNRFVSKEKNGLYVSDECFKMALTDAISVACKMLGIGADVYFESDRSKYPTDNKQQEDTNDAKLTDAQVNRLFAIAKTKGFTAEQVKKAVIKDYKVTDVCNLTKQQYNEVCSRLQNAS